MNQVRPGTPVTVGSVRITPVERVRLEGAAGRRGVVLYASKTPVGLVISTGGQDRAVDLQGNSLSLETVLGEAEGLNRAPPPPDPTLPAKG